MPDTDKARNTTTWYYYDTANKTLRHGHVYANQPGKIQWHRADMRHASDPDAHARCNSWVPQAALSHWSTKPDQETLTKQDRMELLKQAYLRHGVDPEPTATTKERLTNAGLTYARR